ncbi:uncharacterized protein E0L32_011373 [Thyridium curvatum]|uniref:Uncharacterized protein n=1 Tax=Thyridium curvatum TaxID=1093900 RepID=A0A507BQ98_9PEZI|nr:uncharacterized protein E0L32_011373 [Thyridium curvatum]TPX18980.1 hypothetical protein E0L32_011373 [Thyridium curvatum]
MAQQQPKVYRKTYYKDCAVLATPTGPVLAAGNALGVDARISARFVVSVQPDQTSWVGFRLDIPLGKDQFDNERWGYGVRHALDRGAGTDGGSIQPFDQHRIVVKFPRDGATQIDAAEPSTAVKDLFANARNPDRLAWVRVKLSSRPIIEGFGMPFRNVGMPQLDAWVNTDAPIVDKYSLGGLLRQETLYFVVATRVDDIKASFDPQCLPAPFHYPYGPLEILSGAQDWSRLVSAHKGQQFAARYSFETNDEHLTNAMHAVLQDSLWLEEDRVAISCRKWPAYTVRPPSGDASQATEMFMVVPLTQEFKEKFSQSWRCLSRDSSPTLVLYNAEDDDKIAAKWECNIQDHPASIAALNQHPTGELDLVLYARRPQGSKDSTYVVKDFADRSEANRFFECKRRVDALSDFRPGSEPTNLAALVDLPPPAILDRMELHRTLLRGTGFYAWMSQSAPAELGLEDAMASMPINGSRLRPLPSWDFLRFRKDDPEYAQAILEEALGADRTRFNAYLTSRPLGIGIITAGPGFGKTTAGAASTLAMQASLGPILCSAPTNVAVDNFAARLHSRTCAITAKLNAKKGANDPTRYRRKFVVRGFSNEERAFRELLRNPKAGDNALGRAKFGPPSKWKFHLSASWWMLKLLRCPFVDQLDPDDSQVLHEMRQGWDGHAQLDPLRQVLAGTITWEQFQAKAPKKEILVPLFKELFRNADILCVTPSGSHNHTPFRRWKNEVARGVAVDEAANMLKADLLTVWGNTLMPCMLFGDPKQLPPVVLSEKSKDDAGNAVNRFAKDGKVSALQFLQGVGFPVYRLTTQLRMANGMFDMVSSIIYPEVPLRYDSICDINNPRFAAGRTLEDFVRSKSDSVKAAPSGKLLPVFVHCENSRVIVDKYTGSKKSYDQVEVALDMILDLVRTKGITASRVSIIAPYAANVELIGYRRRKEPKYAPLSSMPPASTVDSFQGQENDIVVIVMGTKAVTPGPGFTSDEQRLNVMLTRARCGLVIVGDIHVTGRLDKKDKKAKKGRKDLEETFLVVSSSGERFWSKGTALRNVHKTLWDAGRVMTVKCNEK